MDARRAIVEVTHEQADDRHAAPQDAARPLRHLGCARRRADHRGFRRRPARGPDRAMGALRRRRRPRPSQGTRRLRLDLRARSRARREVVAAEASVRGGRLRAVRSRQHHDRDQRRAQAQLRMGTQEPVRAAAQLPLPALQFERPRARAARLDQQSRAHAQSVSQRSLRVRQRLRLSRAPGRRQVFQRRRRVHPGAARPQHVGDQFHPRSRRLRAQGLGPARRRRLEHDVHPRRRHHARPHLADAGRHLQEGAPPRRRLPRLRRDRARLLAAVVRGRQGLRAHRLEARLGVRAARPDVPPALQYGARSGALSRGRVRQPALSLHHRQAPRVPGHGREREGRRLPDRVRAPGPAHPRDLSRGARQARRDVGHGQVHRRAAYAKTPA